MTTNKKRDLSCIYLQQMGILDALKQGPVIIDDDDEDDGDTKDKDDESPTWGKWGTLVHSGDGG